MRVKLMILCQIWNMMDVPQKRLKAKQNIVTPAFAGFIVRKCQIEGQQLYWPKLLEVLVMIRLFWLSTKVLFLVYGKAQEQSIPKAFKLSFMLAKHTRKVSLLEDLTTKMYICRLPSGFCLWFACDSASEISQISFWNWWSPARTVVDVLEEWGISEKVAALSFDTMATNTAMGVEMRLAFDRTKTW